MTRDPIAFERVDPTEGSVQVFRTHADLAHQPGEVVTTPRGTGVVGGAITENFGFPLPGEGEQEVAASESVPAYIVGFGGRSAPFRASALGPGDLYNQRANSRESEALAQPIAEHGLHEEAMKDNWVTRDLLEWWSNSGGLWRSARERMIDQGMSQDEAEDVVSKRKDMVVGTNRWRRRF